LEEDVFRAIVLELNLHPCSNSIQARVISILPPR